ncbi:hypothetical protein BD626DRAFT_224397 [Schizophyllum amplum]|uniref:Uncharacterized protein n=1 Tax=Schizophyllum amplum TaxID=97359 RepID=A0A550BX74_9AGAR|nr:hypothetical protein BD626DRAFT_224397 [Auriculariopsis ampla]
MQLVSGFFSNLPTSIQCLPTTRYAPKAIIGRAVEDRDVIEALRYARSVRDAFIDGFNPAITGSHVAAAIQYANRVVYSRPPPDGCERIDPDSIGGGYDTPDQSHARLQQEVMQRLAGIEELVQAVGAEVMAEVTNVHRAAAMAIDARRASADSA